MRQRSQTKGDQKGRAARAETRPLVRPRRLLVGLALLLFAWLGWQIIGNTIADTKSISDPDGALTWRSNLPAALLGAAERRLVAAKTGDDLAAVSDLAERALRASPVQEGTLRLDGLVADLGGDGVRARALMEAAGRRSRRDIVAEVWLFDENIQQGRLVDAIANADAVLRTRPDLRDKLLPALAIVAADPAARVSLVALLASDPPWRPWLLAGLPQRTEPSVAFAILSGLETTGRPPRNDEIQAYLKQLIDGGQFELAYLAWLNFLPSGGGKPVNYVYNGDFATAPSGLAFDWVISNVGGAKTETADTGDPTHGSALRVTFANTRVPYSHLSKMMILPAGSYRLSGQARADNLVNERGMFWRIYCAEGDKQVIAESARIKDTTPWHTFSVDFEVPATGCRAQSLRLELAARVALEQQVGGEIWFDDLAVERQPAPAGVAAAPG